MSLGVLEDIMHFDDHRDSDKVNAISATTLLGAKYKAQKYLNKDAKDNSLVDISLKRSSFIGTAFHARAEMITKDLLDYTTEEFLEREITVDDVVYTISGSYDGVKSMSGSNHLYDYKTGYGKDRSEDALAKDAKQMSIYRWLLAGKYPRRDIDDLAYAIFISQSNNVMKEIPVQLMSLEATESYIEDMLYAISVNDRVDCNESVKYNSCSYCSYQCEERS